MPTGVKRVPGVGVLVVGAGCACLERSYGQELAFRVIIGLTAIVMPALWLFPEAGVKDGEKAWHARLAVSGTRSGPGVRGRASARARDMGENVPGDRFRLFFRDEMAAVGNHESGHVPRNASH